MGHWNKTNDCIRIIFKNSKIITQSKHEDKDGNDLVFQSKECCVRYHVVSGTKIPFKLHVSTTTVTKLVNIIGNVFNDNERHTLKCNGEELSP